MNKYGAVVNLTMRLLAKSAIKLSLCSPHQIDSLRSGSTDGPNTALGQHLASTCEFSVDPNGVLLERQSEGGSTGKSKHTPKGPPTGGVAANPGPASVTDCVPITAILTVTARCAQALVVANREVMSLKLVRQFPAVLHEILHVNFRNCFFCDQRVGGAPMRGRRDGFCLELRQTRGTAAWFWHVVVHT